MVVVGVGLWSVWPFLPAGRRWENLARVADYGKDGMFLATIQMNWHQKISDYIRGKKDPNIKLFDGYFFYAEKNSLAFSDMLLVTSMLTYFPVKLGTHPAAGAGVALVVGQLLTMIASYAIFMKLSKNVWGAMIGAIAFGLSQIHFVYQVHLHTWNMTLWLVSYWLFSQKRYLLSGLFLGLQMWESPLGCYFGLFTITARAILNLKFKILNQFSIIKFSIFIFTFGVIAFLPARAYWEVSNHYQYIRTIRDAAHHGLSLNNLDGFWSIGLFTLFASAIWKIKKVTKSLKFFGLLIIISYILALGPVVKWDNKTVKIAGKIPIPLPYAVAYSTVPGWQAFRVPSRWMVLVGWGMGGVVAMGLSNLKFEILNFKSNSNIKIKMSKTFGLIGCLAIAVLGGTKIIKYLDLPKEIPKEYLTDQEVLIFKPIGNEDKETERMYFSILAGKKTMNGFSGFLPPERVKFLLDK